MPSGDVVDRNPIVTEQIALVGLMVFAVSSVVGAVLLLREEDRGTARRGGDGRSRR